MSKLFNHPSGRSKNFLRIRIRKYHIFSGKPYPQHGGQLCSPIEITESGTETHDCPYHSRYCKPQCRGTQNRPCKVRDTLGTELVCFVYIGYRCAHPIRMKNIYIYIYIYKNMENKDIINKYTSVCNVYEDTAQSHNARVNLSSLTRKVWKIVGTNRSTIMTREVRCG